MNISATDSFFGIFGLTREKPKVYLVIRYSPFDDGMNIDKVFSTQEKAEEYITKTKEADIKYEIETMGISKEEAEYYCDSYNIREMEVNN